MAVLEEKPLDGTFSLEEIELVCVRNLLASSEERVYFKDLESRFLLVSAGWLEAEGQQRSLDAVIGRTDFDFFSHRHAAKAFADEQEIIRTGKPLVAELELETFHNRPGVWVSTTKLPLRDSRGQIIGTFGISRDVTAQIEAEAALEHQASHDAVTGLANRVALVDRLRQALVGLERQPGRVGLLFIDLDDFKGINDGFGHETGDRVLAEVAARLKRVARRTDTVARLAGDEFVLLTALDEPDDLRPIGDRVLTALRAPLRSAPDVKVTGSVGGVSTSDPATDPSHLLKQSDLAMYVAKRGGRNRLEIYDSAVHNDVASARSMAVELRRAIDRRELTLVYQPFFSLQDGSPIGLEALVRWQHPDRGAILPTAFIPQAEQHGLIVELDAFVLGEASRQLAVWTRADPAWREVTMSVNVSGRSLCDSDLARRVMEALDDNGLEPERLCLEITETALIGEIGDAHDTVAALLSEGVKIALDDFGTGYSTLAHVRQLQAGILKIDGSFICNIGRSKRDRMIIAGVTAMAHALGMSVVAEGVETDSVRAVLIDIGCDAAQGYLLAPPLRADEIAELWTSAQVRGRPRKRRRPGRR